MVFLKRDINLNILFLTVIAAIMILISSSVFYNQKLGKMQDEYDEKITNLKAIEGKLILEEQRLKNLAQSKETTEKDKETLENNYFDMHNENENLKNKLSSFSVVEKTVCKASGDAKCVS